MRAPSAFPSAVRQIMHTLPTFICPGRDRVDSAARRLYARHERCPRAEEQPWRDVKMPDTAEAVSAGLRLQRTRSCSEFTGSATEPEARWVRYERAAGGTNASYSRGWRVRCQREPTEPSQGASGADSPRVMPIVTGGRDVDDHVGRGAQRAARHVRPTTSLLPPGGNGTISRTGLSGYDCAATLPASSRAARQERIFIGYIVAVAGATRP